MTKAIITIVSFGIAVGVFFMYTQPQYDEVNALRSDIAQFDSALTKSNQMQELKRELISKYNTFGADQLNRLTHLLPDHVDNVRLVLDLDSMASRYGMPVQNVVVDRPDVQRENQATVIGALSSQAATFDSVTLRFTTQGTYANFVALLQDLELSLRIVDVVQITIDPVGDQKDEKGVFIEPQYRFDVTLKTYWLK